MALIIALAPLSKVINLVWKVAAERDIFTSLCRQDREQDTQQKFPEQKCLIFKMNYCR